VGHDNIGFVMKLGTSKKEKEVRGGKQILQLGKSSGRKIIFRKGRLWKEKKQRKK